MPAMPIGKLSGLSKPDSLTPPSTPNSPFPEDFAVNLDECSNLLNLLLQNQFDQLQFVSQGWRHRSVYHHLCGSMLPLMYASLTQNKDDIEFCIKSLKDTIAFCYKRRKSITSRFFTRVVSPNASPLVHTEDELHTDIVIAHSNLFLVLLGLFDEQSHFTQIRSSIRLKTAHNLYRTCKELLNKSVGWNSKLSQQEAERGVQFGLNLIHLFINHPPPGQESLLKLASIMPTPHLDIRFVHSKNELQSKVGQISDNIGLHRKMSAVFTSGMIIFARHTSANSSVDLNMAAELITELLNSNPSSCLLLFLRAKLDQLLGCHRNAIVRFRRCFESQFDWPYLQFLCVYNISISHAIQLNWLAAAQYARFLHLNSMHWPVLSRYMYLCFMQMHLNVRYHCGLETDRADDYVYHSTEHTNSDYTQITFSLPKTIDSVEDKTDEQFSLDNRLAPTEEEFNRQLKQMLREIATWKPDKHSSPIEVFIHLNAQRCLDTGYLILPALELFYILDIFGYFNERQELVEPLLALIQIELIEHDEAKDEPNCDMDNFALLYVLKAKCLKCLGKIDEAIDCLKEVMYCESRIRRDHHLVYAVLIELPLLLAQAGKHFEANYYAERTRPLLNRLADRLQTALGVGVKRLFSVSHSRLQMALDALESGGGAGPKAPSSRRLSVAMLRRQNTVNTLCSFTDPLLEGHLAKLNNRRRASLTSFLRTNLLGE